ncbi:Transcription factor IWS1 [Lecanosticta acicola]|uniref:Transcription factor IWS1 n=1 Tax=Lecanosticta acicola TaxID=111012 RepID=A0AAI8Z7G9_9PEZI|nr:Transcription factor IWS1 [Lecanosticta acicola]
MEDLEQPDGPPSTYAGPEPQGNDDPQDPLRPDIEEENGAVGTPPMADPYADMETREDDEHPATPNGSKDDEAENADGNPDNTGAAAEDDDDLESELEELDDKEFENFDPSALNIPDKPIDVDESNVGLLGVHKRKRTDEEQAEYDARKKKRKEKKSRRRRGGDEDDFEGGEEVDGKRSRKSKAGADGRKSKAGRARTPEDEENLSPEERRRRALDRKMDEALKTNRVSRRKAAQDAEERADAEIETMRSRIIQACQKDQEARARGEVATAKIEVLPAVVELMNRNTIQSQLVDPEVNMLEAIRFMLEPADQDAALPNYQIQRELFAILGRLNMSKETLISSGIGKIVLFYTKSTQPQPDIKRQAERLTGEWMRVILNKSKDRRNLHIQQRQYDPLVAQASQRSAASSQANRAAIAAAERRKRDAGTGPTNRARVEGGVGTYTIAPVSNLSNAQGVSARKLGASGEEAFRKMQARSQMKKQR